VERNLAISIVRDTILKAGGWIVDHHLFSNIAATINFKIASKSLHVFENTLAHEGFQVFIEGEVPDEDAGDLLASVSLTFLHEEPDLKRDVPPFG
jgi:hypothetical protein